MVSDRADPLAAQLGAPTEMHFDNPIGVLAEVAIRAENELGDHATGHVVVWLPLS